MSPTAVARSLTATPLAVNPRRGRLVYGRFPRFDPGFTGIAGALHPWSCLCCGAPGQPGLDLCRACNAELPWLGHGCERCAMPLSRRARAPVCAACRRDPPPFDAALIPFRYAFPIDRLIIGLKFASRLERARLLGTLLAPWLEGWLVGSARPAALIPAPLHPARARSRGFNQAIEIARPVAARLGVPLMHDAVVRVRATAEQSTLDAVARRANLRDAFAVRAALPAHVAMLDDVVTTSATAGALALALRAAGVERITLIAVARAI